MKRIRRLLATLTLRLTGQSEWIADGFGNRWPRYCHECGREMQIVRPGVARCAWCYDNRA